MAEEEFQKFEVLFSDQTSNHYGTHDEVVATAIKDDGGYLDNPEFTKNDHVSRNHNSDKNTITTKKKTVACSVPVNNQHHHGRAAFDCGVEFEEYDDGEMKPPHVFLTRKTVGKMAFSACTGNIMTLKGGDLSQVRNSVLRMTGFLEVEHSIFISKTKLKEEEEDFIN